MWSENSESIKVKDKIAELKEKINSEMSINDDMREVVLEFLESIESMISITDVNEEQDLIHELGRLEKAWDMEGISSPRRQALSYAMGTLTAVMQGLGEINLKKNPRGCFSL